MATILMTGITGTIGNPLAVLLLKRGHTIVAVVRNAQSREIELRTQLSLSVEENKRLFVIPGDIVTGVDVRELARWRGNFDATLHFAASTKFFETPDLEVHRTNVVGTQTVLLLAENLGIPEFHYASTIHVKAGSPKFMETDIPIEGNGRNPYEDSKISAEGHVRRFSRCTSIYRLPIVVGDSQTGEISSFTGFYGFFAAFRQLHKILLRKWRDNRQECLDNGIWVDEEDRIHIPLYVPCTRTGTINLVTRDWIARMLADLFELPAQGKTFHLSHPNPTPLMEGMITCLERLGFQGMRCGEEPKEPQPRLLAGLQRRVLQGIAPYIPYTSADKEVLGDDVIRSTGKWTEPPYVDLGRLITAADQRGFGRP